MKKMKEIEMNITKWKKTIWKELCTVWFQLYSVLEKAKLRRL